MRIVGKWPVFPISKLGFPSSEKQSSEVLTTSLGKSFSTLKSQLSPIVSFKYHLNADRSEHCYSVVGYFSRKMCNAKEKTSSFSNDRAIISCNKYRN